MSAGAPMRRVVIVGAGLAGHRAALALRERGFDGELTIVGDEAHRPYDRPPLSKELLGGAKADGDCFYRCDELGGVEWALGEPAVGLDLERGAVRLAGGEELPYDGLVIASGRRAREWPGLPDLGGFHVLRSLDDSVALREAVGPRCRVAIVGAGFIGCEVASTLRGRGVEEVTLIDVAPHPLPALGAEVGERAARLHRERGVRLLLDASVAGFEGEGRVEAVRMADGERVEADLVLLALGSVPNSEWLVDSGLELHAGCVLCDEGCFALRTDDVVAAGDIAAWPHPAVGEPVWVEHWTNARDMGAAAAANLLAGADEAEPYAPVPTFWSDQYDTKIKSAGFIGRADSYRVVEEDPERPALVVEAHRDGELIGAVVFNRNRTIINYQRELRRRQPVPAR